MRMPQEMGFQVRFKNAKISPFQNIIFLTWFVSMNDLDNWWRVTKSIVFTFFHRIKFCQFGSRQKPSVWNFVHSVMSDKKDFAILAWNPKISSLFSQTFCRNNRVSLQLESSRCLKKRAIWSAANSKLGDRAGDKFFSPESQIVSLYATIAVNYVRQEYPATWHWLKIMVGQVFSAG
jgi:hypothetical protein